MPKPFLLPILLYAVLSPLHQGTENRRGPVDGSQLPATDIDRVALGKPAPDFILNDLGGKPIQLSGYRGKSIVVLVFYRGHW